MSSAGSDTPRSADELPELSAAQVMIREAAPDPPPGPIREQMAEQAAQRTDRAVDLMEAAVRRYNDRLAGLIEARMRGPKARKGTRWWADSAKIVSGTVHPPLRTGTDLATKTLEVKALDGSYILPERVVSDELAEAIRPVGLRIVSDAAASVARGLGRPNVGLAAFDHGAIERAIDSVVGRMLEVNERHARDVRREILGADATAESLDEAIDRVMEATKRGGRWLLINGRTLATALAGDAALGAAKSLGVTHSQWLSRRDGQVRSSHVIADGQVRPIGDKFSVGQFRLRFPADPFVLPAGAEEVYNCRCSLIWAPPDTEKAKAIRLAENGTPAPAYLLADPAVRRGASARRVELLPERGRQTLSEDTPTPERLPRVAIVGVPGAIRMIEGAPELGAPLSVPQVTVSRDVVAYRRLNADLPVAPGQRISWPGPLALGLAPTATEALAPTATEALAPTATEALAPTATEALAPTAAGALTLAVVLAAGTAVGVSGGAAVLPAAAELEVLAVTADQIVARPVPVVG